MKRWFVRQKSRNETIEQADMPKHVAIIMDGNGRWANERGLPRLAGHHAGMKNVKRIAITANRAGIQILTLYAFSTENWTRPREEIDYILGLPKEFFPLEIEELDRNNIQVRMMGYEEDLPEHTLEPVLAAIERTRNNTGMILNFALNYGSRKEIVSVVQRLADEVKAGRLQSEMITEETISACLFSADLADPDLLIRTSGELRISNFMLWQLAYTELWFADVYWPAFKEQHFTQAIEDYMKRKRRFGGLQHLEE